MTDEKHKFKRSKKKTIGSLSFFRAILESTVYGILVLDSHGQVVDFNEKFIELWSVPTDLQEQENDAGLIQHLLDQLEDPETFAEKIRRQVSEREDEIAGEVHFTNGRMIECHFIPHRLDGAIVGKILNFRDITEHRKSDEVFQEHEKRYHNIIEGIEEGYYETDLAGNCTFANEA